VIARALRGRLGRLGSQDGLTLIELLVASAMSVILLGAVGSMVVSAMNTQPRISKKAANVQTARWVMERLTREIRNGVAVDNATATSVSFRTYVRRTSCGGSGTLPSGSPAIRCEVTYTCDTTSCSRIEANEGVYTGTATTVFSGINSSDVFCYVPSTNPDPLTCGPAASAAQATYIGIDLRIPNTDGPGALTVSDGASLRNATLDN
jgi:prepilin-type N-terminal cleavage/methylation domain-containing protein